MTTPAPVPPEMRAMPTSVGGGGEGVVNAELLSAPFPYFGGKSRVASEIWQRLGDVDSYVEPFCGSLAVLLARPHKPQTTETVNDVDRFLANFWRAVKHAPAEVAEWADWPVNEVDLEARHYWLVTKGRDRLADFMGDPEGYDAKVAGWWVWGACAWIGSGWCSGEGPWRWDGEAWINRRKLPHLGGDRGINRQLPRLSGDQGINRQLPHLGEGRGNGILDWFATLSARLRTVRVACGDWSRVCGDGITTGIGTCGVLLDPPYSAPDRAKVYSNDCFEVAHKARAWAIERGSNPKMRIAFCGYDGEFADPWPDGWTEYAWKAKGGYGNRDNADGENVNAKRERIWFSPHCEDNRQVDIFARYLPHGQEPEPGETVSELRGHHGHYSRLAVRQA